MPYERTNTGDYARFSCKIRYSSDPRRFRVQTDASDGKSIRKCLTRRIRVRSLSVFSRVLAFTTYVDYGTRLRRDLKRFPLETKLDHNPHRGMRLARFYEHADDVVFSRRNNIHDGKMCPTSLVFNYLRTKFRTRFVVSSSSFFHSNKLQTILRILS